MEYIYTDGYNQDFIELCHDLDDFLKKLSEEKKTGLTIFSIINLLIFMMWLLCMIIKSLLEVRGLRNMIVIVQR